MGLPGFEKKMKKFTCQIREGRNRLSGTDMGADVSIKLHIAIYVYLNRYSYIHTK